MAQQQQQELYNNMKSHSNDENFVLKFILRLSDNGLFLDDKAAQSSILNRIDADVFKKDVSIVLSLYLLLHELIIYSANNVST